MEGSRAGGRRGGDDSTGRALFANLKPTAMQPQSTAATIHVIEPTLSDFAGHCHSFIASLCQAGPEYAFEVWGDLGAGPLLAHLPNVRLHRYFRRRVRKLQAFFLYRRLMAREGRIFVPTSGSMDLSYIDYVSRGSVPRGKVSLYFQWIRPSPAKLERYARVAQHLPDLDVMGQTPTVARFLKEAGFSNARAVPYPTTFRVPPGEPSFGHLLYAGAARRDKGFARVVDLVQALRSDGRELPILVQTCGDYFGKIDAETRRDLDRLAQLHYPFLKTQPKALDTPEFLKLFPGAICLQPYDPVDFADRFSNVTVDAFRSGAPVVTTAGTWLGYQVERFDAGIALEELSEGSMLGAIDEIIADYPSFSRNALEAGRALEKEHSPSHLLEAITS